MICIDTMIITIIDIYNIGIITRVILIAIACIILAVIHWIIITILSGLLFLSPLLSMILVYSLCRTNIQHIWYVIYGRVWKWGIPPNRGPQCSDTPIFSVWNQPIAPADPARHNHHSGRPLDLPLREPKTDSPCCAARPQGCNTQHGCAARTSGQRTVQKLDPKTTRILILMLYFCWSEYGNWPSPPLL